MKSLAVSVYPFSSHSRSSISMPRPSSYSSIKFINRRGFQARRAVNEEEEEEQQQQQEEEEVQGKGKRKPSVSLSRLSVENVEAMAGLGTSRRRSRSRSRSKGKLDAEPLKPKPEIKDWESMSLQEKLLQIYVGEKGILFWLNKLAYASIFIVVGGWIAFRFVGPSLGLYQLQSSLLEPTKAFGGGS